MNQDPTKDLYSKKLYFIEHRDYNDDQSFCFMALAAVATRHVRSRKDCVMTTTVRYDGGRGG